MDAHFEQAYPLALVLTLLGIRRLTLTVMQRDELKCALVGSWKFVSGKVLRRFLDELADRQAGTPRG